MMPSRRRKAAAARTDIDEERSLVMRILLHSPKDLFAGSLAFAAVGAIVANAMFMQAGHHPSPMFGSGGATPLALPQANPLPRPRPVEADTASVRPAESSEAPSANPAQSAAPSRADSDPSLSPAPTIPAGRVAQARGRRPRHAVSDALDGREDLRARAMA